MCDHLNFTQTEIKTSSRVKMHLRLSITGERIVSQWITESFALFLLILRVIMHKKDILQYLSHEGI